MVFVIGKVCPGIKNRTGAIIAGVAALCFASVLIVNAILAMLFTYREDLRKVDRRTEEEKEMIQCYYGAGFALWGVWVMFTIVMLFGIVVENKRALGFWLIFTLLVPLYFVSGLIFLLVATRISGWEISYLCTQGACLVSLVWICLAIWVYFGEIKQRDKNPELRENEIMFAQPFSGIMPPSGSYNPGYGAPGGGSMSSIPRSQKSRHTYAPTEAGESVRGGPTAPRQSRLDQYRAQHVEKSPIKSDRSPSGEREGGTAYYRYQYTTDQKPNGSHHGSQGSLGGRPNYDPPQYQPARYQPRNQAPPPSFAQLQENQGSLGGRQAYQPAHHASQGSMGGRQPYQPHASQGSLGARQAYQPQFHASQGSLGGRPAYQLQNQPPQDSKDSEV